VYIYRITKEIKGMEGTLFFVFFSPKMKVDCKRRVFFFFFFYFIVEGKVVERSHILPLPPFKKI
jgi:hypothetical protein